VPFLRCFEMGDGGRGGILSARFPRSPGIDQIKRISRKPLGFCGFHHMLNHTAFSRSVSMQNARKRHTEPGGKE